MIQCIICEDWFHSQVKLILFILEILLSFQHLGVPLPMEENEVDIICQTCVTKYPFLVHYNG
jgi:hypothetical protein